MLRLALRNLASRKLRFAMTAIAIVLGTAMMSGTYVLTDQITGAFDQIFAKANQGVDVLVTRKQAFDSRQGAQPGPLPESLVATVQAVPGVRSAEGQMAGIASLVVDGKSATSVGGAPALLFSTPKTQQFSSVKLTAGHEPTGPNELAVDEDFADRKHLKVGKAVQVATPTGLHPATIVGIFRFANSASMGGAILLATTFSDAQKWLGQENKVSTIAVAGTSDTDTGVLKRRIEAALPKSGILVETGSENADRQAKSVNEGIGFIGTILGIFALIAILVGSFVIFNVFSITIAQRIREIAMMRTIGATRGQVRWSVLAEALIVGLVASLIGIGLGVLIAIGLKALFSAVGFGLPTASITVKPRTALVPIVVGTVVTVLSAVIPAARATRIPPVTALREGAVIPKSRFAKFVPWLGLAAAVIGVTLVFVGFGSDAALGTRLQTIGVGAACIVIGIGLAMRLMIRPLARVVGAPMQAVFGNSAAIARQNATRDTVRTASTATALMIGVGLVVFIAVFVNGFKNSFFDAIDRTMLVDHATINENFNPMPPGIVAAARSVPAVEDALGIGTVDTQINGKTAPMSAIDPVAARKLVNFDWRGDASQATLDQLGSDGAVVEEGFAHDNGLAVGKAFDVLAIDGQRARFTVRGLYRDPQLLTGYTISNEGLKRLTDNPQVQILLTKLRPGTDLQVGTEQLRAALKSTYPTAKVRTKAEYKDFVNTSISVILSIFYALLALSIVISLVGVIITLLLAIYERTREIGMMRAVGTTRGQIRAMILHEGAITCVIGGIVGVCVGLLLGWIVTKGLESEGLGFSVPVGALILVLMLTVVAGLLAAAFPARRAARLQPLDALHYE